MNPPLQTIRLSKQDVDVLNSLKRRTKITQWNILCRMAFALSCKDESAPSDSSINKVEGHVEMDWATFGGDYSELYNSLLIAHINKTKFQGTPSEYFKKLLTRGILKLKENV